MSSDGRLLLNKILKFQLHIYYIVLHCTLKGTEENAPGYCVFWLKIEQVLFPLTTRREVLQRSGSAAPREQVNPPENYEGTNLNIHEATSLTSLA